MKSLARLLNIDQHMMVSHYPNHSIGMLLYSLAYANKSSCLVEIGYNLGYSAVMLCAGLRDTGASARMVSIDIAPCDGGNIVRANGFGDLHRFVQGDSVAVAGQVTSLLGRPIELLLIDGDHSYEGCKRDWLAYKDHLHEQAIVLFHDNYLPAIQRVLDEIEQTSAGWRIVDLNGHAGLSVMRRQKAGIWTENSRSS